MAKHKTMADSQQIVALLHGVKTIMPLIDRCQIDKTLYLQKRPLQTRVETSRGEFDIALLP